MIDWVNLTFTALWIAGLAVILAAFSYHDWLARESDRRLRDVLSQPSWRLPFSGGMLLACVGFAQGLGDRLWEKTVWMVLAMSFAYQFVTLLRHRRNDR